MSHPGDGVVYVWLEVCCRRAADILPYEEQSRERTATGEVAHSDLFHRVELFLRET